MCFQSSKILEIWQNMKKKSLCLFGAENSQKVTQKNFISLKISSTLFLKQKMPSASTLQIFKYMNTITFTFL